MDRRAMLLAVAFAVPASFADPPVTEGRVSLSVIGAYGQSNAAAHGLPATGSMQALVSIGHVDRAQQYYAGGRIVLRNEGGSLVIDIAKEDHGQWPVTASYFATGVEPRTLELHLVGISPTQARTLKVSWGKDHAPRVLFGEHQEVEFGPVGFTPESLELITSFGVLALDDLRIRAAGAAR